MAKRASARPNRKPPHQRRSRKLGLPAGALIHLGERKAERAVVTLVEYGPDGLEESCWVEPEAGQPGKQIHPKLWLNVHGLHEPEMLREIGRRFGLHPLVLEDILNTDQRPKVDDYGDYLFVIARLFAYNPAAPDFVTEQVSFVIGRDFVLTFQERATGSFDPVREWLRSDKGGIRQKGTDYLAYALLDVLVDGYFSVLEEVGERTEQLEEDLMARPDAVHLETMHRYKRETLTLRRAIWPLREVVNTLVRNEGRFFADETQLYLRDIYDHTVHLIESLEAIRDLIAGMLDIYLSSISNRVNQQVRTLTVFALIFMPATLIAGIFGMNFKSLPMLDDPNGFALALGLMGAVALMVGLIFWRRRWLE